MPELSTIASAYDASAVDIGIVHLGLGAFHRAHQATCIERHLARHGGGDWGICAANIRSNAALPEALEAQNGRYHVIACRDREHIEIAEVQAIRRAIFAGTEKTELLQWMTRPATRIVSLTITEKGYHLSPSTGELLEHDAAIAHDLDAPSSPVTAPGLIVEALRQRRQRGLTPFTVLSCDNMPNNGSRTRNAVTALAAIQSPELAEWIHSYVAFPATMVDRIVPAMTPERQLQAEQLIGEADSCAVFCESFSQWVVEDSFCAGRPDWEQDGVEVVDDVTPWETLKLRMLNGSHSLLAYAGLARGFQTVAEAVGDPDLRSLVCAYFAETEPALTPAAGINTHNYASALLERFANDAIEHRLSQIAMDGSQKLPQRWLDGAAVNMEMGLPFGATATGVAAWMTYVRGENMRGEQWKVDDPLSARLADCHRRATEPGEVVAALLAVDAIFPPALAASTVFVDQVLSVYRTLTDT